VVDPLQIEKKTAQIGGAGNVEAPAPTITGRSDRRLLRVPLGKIAHNNEAVVMVGEWSPKPEKEPQEETQSQKEKDVASAALGRKGTVIHLYALRDEQP
jgi:hypothetical protein